MSRGKSRPKKALVSDVDSKKERKGTQTIAALATTEVALKDDFQEDYDDIVGGDIIGGEELKPSGKAAIKRKSATSTQRGIRDKKKETKNPFVILLTFFRQVLAELRKVHWISRKQSIVYTLVVIAFVAFCVVYVAGLDILFQYLMGLFFGDTPRGDL